MTPNDRSAFNTFTRRCMDPLGQSRPIGIHSAGNDAPMSRFLLMQTHEMPTIERQHRAMVCGGECQDRLVRPALPRVAGFLDGQDIMRKTPQLQDDRQGEVLVEGKRGQVLTFNFSCTSSSPEKLNVKT